MVTSAVQSPRLIVHSPLSTVHSPQPTVHSPPSECGVNFRRIDLSPRFRVLTRQHGATRLTLGASPRLTLDAWTPRPAPSEPRVTRPAPGATCHPTSQRFHPPHRGFLGLYAGKHSRLHQSRWIYPRPERGASRHAPMPGGPCLPFTDWRWLETHCPCPNSGEAFPPRTLPLYDGVASLPPAFREVNTAIAGALERRRGWASPGQPKSPDASRMIPPAPFGQIRPDSARLAGRRGVGPGLD